MNQKYPIGISPESGVQKHTQNISTTSVWFVQMFVTTGDRIQDSRATANAVAAAATHRQNKSSIIINKKP